MGVIDGIGTIRGRQENALFGMGELERRVARLEGRVRVQDEVINQLCARLGIDPVAADPLGQVDTEERLLISQGKHIHAIKHHRERTGSTLRQAKEAIDRARGVG